MTKRCVPCITLCLLLLGAGGASADPTNWPQLGRIILTLQRIDATLHEINNLVNGVKEKLLIVYPEQALRTIQTVFEPVDSIQREVEKLACHWSFTPRVDRLRLALFGGGSFCRDDWNVVFGPPTVGADWDLESYYDWSAVRRVNMVKTRNEKSRLRAEQASWLAAEALKGSYPNDFTKPYSPGYSQRLSALGAAQLGNVMVEMGDTQAALLELDQENVNDKRRRRLLDHETAALVYAGLTSLREPAPGLHLLGGHQ